MTRSLPLGRRAILRAAPALLAAPAFGQSPPADLEAHARSLDQLHALALSRRGEEVLAVAPRGPGLDRPANVKSVSKTILALMTGIAIERGILEGPEQRVLPLLGRGPAGDARDALTVGDLLSMRTGLASTSGGDYGAWIASGNWVDYVLSRELVDRPGGRFIYSTGGWHVLGAALSGAAGQSLHSLAREWIGAPLGLDLPPWARDPQGNFLGGNEMAVSPRGLLRIGETVLGGGVWEGARVVPEAWIETSWEPRARSPWSGDAYGYGWFLTRIAGREAAYARGYGGQVLAVVPEEDIALAITSDPLLPARSGGYFSDLRALMEHAVETAAAA